MWCLLYIQCLIISDIENFKAKIEIFHSQNELTKEIVKRFDLIICEKASKIELQSLKSSLSNYVPLSRFEAISDFKSSVIEDLDLMYLRINDIKKDIKGNLSEMMAKATKEIYNRIVCLPECTCSYHPKD
jgi:hypothetical protein